MGYLPPTLNNPGSLPPVPRRGASEQEINAWNQALRASPIYQAFMTAHGLPTDGSATLTRDQQGDLQMALAANGLRIPDDMHIDQGGNLNQKNRTSRNVGVAAGIGGAALLTAGAAGAFAGPAAGGAGGAAGGAGAAGAGAVGSGIGTGAGIAGTTLGGGAGTATGIGTGAGLAGTTLGGGAGATTIGTGAGLAGTSLGGGAGLAGAAGGGGSLLGRVLTNPDTWSTVGSMASGAAGGMANERAGQMDAESRQHQTQQYALTNLLGLQEGATMNRAQMGLDAPGQRSRQAVLGSLIQNMQNAKVTPPPGVRMGQVSGGLNPSLLSAATRAGGGELERQALMALMSKSDVPPPTNYPQSGLLEPPKYQGAGAGETLLSTLGLLGTGAGALRRR